MNQYQEFADSLQRMEEAVTANTQAIANLTTSATAAAAAIDALERRLLLLDNKVIELGSKSHEHTAEPEPEPEPAKRTIFEGNFSTPELFYNNIDPNRSPHASIEVVDDSTLKQGLSIAGKSCAFTVAHGAYRAEAGPREGNENHIQRSPFFTPLRYAWRMRLASDWKSDKHKSIITQVHAIPDIDLGEKWRSPPLSIFDVNNKLYVRSRTSDKKVSGSGAYVDLYSSDWPVPYGEVLDWQLDVCWDWRPEGNGYLRLKLNNQSLVDHVGPNCFNDEQGPYFKFGLYRPAIKEQQYLENSLVNSQTVICQLLQVEMEVDSQ